MYSGNFDFVVILNASAFCFSLLAFHLVTWKVVINVFQESVWSADQAKFGTVARDLIG